MRIKLVAIAQDNAAYLPEWIFHHLYFGFDEIEIYVGYTTDNSYEILEKICKNYPVKYKNSEYLVEHDYNQYDSLVVESFLKANPLQGRAYAEAFARSKTTAFSHIMFLSINEYWIHNCFTKNIKQELTDLGEPAVTSFLWKNRVGETTEFGRPFCIENRYKNSTIQKVMLKTELEIKIIGAHKCRILNKDNHHTKQLQETNSSFVLHRLQRSEMEYISLLGRGIEKDPVNFDLEFNRVGFIDADNSLMFSLDKDILEKYNEEYRCFLIENDLEEDIELAKKFVSERSSKGLEYIRNTVSASKIVNKVIKGLSIEKELYPKRGK